MQGWKQRTKDTCTRQETPEISRKPREAGKQAAGRFLLSPEKEPTVPTP